MKQKQAQQESVWTKRELKRLERLFQKDPAEMFDEIRRLMHEQYKDMPPEEYRDLINEEGRQFAKRHGLKYVDRVPER